jgi:hypothetical protein
MTATLTITIDDDLVPLLERRAQQWSTILEGAAADALREGLGIQCPRYTDTPKSWTELARVVGQKLGWTIDPDDQIVDGSGLRVAASVEDAAAAIEALDWFAEFSPEEAAQHLWAGIVWGIVQAHDAASAATAVRRRLDPQGRHLQR